MRRFAMLLPVLLVGAAFGASAGPRAEAGEGCAPRVPTEAARAFDRDFFRGMSREEVAASLENMRLEIEAEDEALLGPPPED